MCVCVCVGMYVCVYFPRCLLVRGCKCGYVCVYVCVCVGVILSVGARSWCCLLAYKTFCSCLIVQVEHV